MPTTDTRTQLHYHYAQLAGQMLVTLIIGVLIGAAMWWAPTTVQATHAVAPTTPQLVQVASTDVPDEVWQDMLNHGATSDPTDACECLYAQPGSLYGPTGQQWTITPDGAEPAGAN